MLFDILQNMMEVCKSAKEESKHGGQQNQSKYAD